MRKRSRLSSRSEILVDSILLFFLTGVLIFPLFGAGYWENWGSIESLYVSHARFLMDHWPHPLWQPLWYTGTRFDYVYPPAIGYATAVVSRITGVPPVSAYHTYTAFFYCLGIAGVYGLARQGMRSRKAAWLAASATALLSPAFLFLRNYRLDSPLRSPERLHVLLKWGEGGHITALALIPFALVFGWRALETRRPADVALAAVITAAVVSHNFPGTIALSFFYLALVWSFAITRPGLGLFWPACAIPALAYGLTAWWLVPSYFRLTAENLKYVEGEATGSSVMIAVVALAIFGAVSYGFAHRRPERTWTVFLSGIVLVFSLIVLGDHFFHLSVVGQPQRFIPELDLALILGILAVLQTLWSYSGSLPRILVLIFVLAAFGSTVRYLRHPWRVFPAASDYRNRVEYRVTEWLWKNMPEARTASNGSVRFWFDTWHDLAELGGSADQAMMNPLALAASWEINAGPRPELSVLWMQCLGVDAAYVPDQRSQDFYKDVRYPLKYAGVLPVIYDDGEGNKIYQVPRRYAAHVRVAEAARLDSLRPPRDNQDMTRLKAYADVMERGPDVQPVLTRTGPDAMRVQAHLERGQTIVVQESYDPAWEAFSGNRRVPIRKDALGFMIVDAPPGDQEIRLEFVKPLEARIGLILTFLACALVLGMLYRSMRTNEAAGRPGEGQRPEAAD